MTYFKCVCINMCTLSQLLGAEKAWKCLNDWTELERWWRNASAIHLCCWLKATKCIFQVEVQRILFSEKKMQLQVLSLKWQVNCKHYWMIIAVWWNIKSLVWWLNISWVDVNVWLDECFMFLSGRCRWHQTITVHWSSSNNIKMKSDNLSIVCYISPPCALELLKKW